MFNILKKINLFVLGFIVTAAFTLTGCSKDAATPKPKQQKTCERHCSHLKKTEKAVAKTVVKKKRKCVKCGRYECVCLKMHEDTDELLEHRSLDFK